MTETPISLTNLSLTTFSGNDPNYSALEFWNSVEQKINFSLGPTRDHMMPAKRKIMKIGKGTYLDLCSLILP